MPQIESIKAAIRTVPDFPSPGIQFYDIGPLLGNGELFADAVDLMAKPLKDHATKVVGFDARGFIFGAAIARVLGVGFVPLRKAGKLPGAVVTETYDLEYGSNTLQIQADALTSEDKVVLVDDVIATGGTALAGVKLVRSLGAEILGCSALIDLPFLGGSQQLEAAGVPVSALLRMGGEAV